MTFGALLEESVYDVMFVSTPLRLKGPRAPLVSCRHVEANPGNHRVITDTQTTTNCVQPRQKKTTESKGKTNCSKLCASDDD